ncbi:unnamed protein product [Ceratitis capitata]|uniref:(Mediterranean fruit fly) hypothetical protein n=1 Tax=Ceratitis capitata TaxID=7213 RepID=A0A811UHJ3_CERCA|nr:unnamed protein product [Ceratitis capitata]
MGVTCYTSSEACLSRLGSSISSLYNSIDTGFISVYIMHPFWNWCVQFLPKWLAPNLITFTGFLLTVVNFILIAYYDWDFQGANHAEHPVPSWVWSVAAINILLYYNLGKYAGSDDLSQ